MAVKNIFGFYPRNINLYKLALRHKSATAKKINGLKINNERLEYLGDAILSAIVADYLFRRFPYKDEGFLTQMRSKIVSRTSLNRLSLKLGLQKLVVSVDMQSNQPKSAGGDAFEAFIGAVFLDKGYNFTKKIILNRIIGVHFDVEQLVEEEVSYKSRIIEWSQKQKKDIQFRVVNQVGEKNKRQYVVSLLIDNKVIATSQDYSIKGAERLVAEKAWQKIEEPEKE
ncbi:MAG: ribonuclease III [Bacteroidetes bacterium]|nr:MAG: ribonuclease III [Bacteroidota bacterium]